MKKLYTLIGFSFLAFQAEQAFAQNFQFKIVQTKVYGDTATAGDIEIDGNRIINLTSNPVTIDAVRVTDVGGTWTSAFCLDVCYAPFMDSVQYTIPPNDSVPYIPHFYIDASPDSQCIYMKIKNANNPSEVAYGTFCGVTKIGYGAGIHEYANLANVSIYPSPVKAGSAFSISITNAKVQATEYSLIVSDMYGKTVSKTMVKTGSNNMDLNLAAGMYAYRLVAAGKTLRAGKISVVK